MSDVTPSPHDDWRSRRHAGETGSWIAGVILILLGVAFMLERSGIFTLTGNWWSIFIYLGAFAGFANAWRSYRAGRGFDSAAGGSLTWGLRAGPQQETLSLSAGSAVGGMHFAWRHVATFFSRTTEPLPV